MFLLDGFKALLAVACLTASLPVWAQFALAISPPRFELSTQPGERVREVIQLTSDDPQAGTYTVRTADWRFDSNGGVVFSDELVPGSCRPWVAVERREVTVSNGRPYRFRFEVQPPVGTPPTECRFAIMLEGKTLQGLAAPPISARVGVIVYIGVGAVAPQLVVMGSGVQTVEGRQLPFVEVRNDGTAHGRLDGFLTATDAAGREVELTPATPPILPGQSRPIALAPVAPEGQAPVSLTFPLRVRGKLEWGKGQSTSIDQRFAP